MPLPRPRSSAQSAALCKAGGADSTSAEGSISIEFFAAGIPKGQPRPRAFSRGGIAKVYDPGTAEGWKGQVALAANPFLPPWPLEGPLHVRLDFCFPRPKNHYRKAGLKPDAPKHHIAKPDADNAAKAVFDALTILGMWKDDSQIAGCMITKFYAERPGCFIFISSLA